MKKQSNFSHTTSYMLLATLFLIAFAERVFFDMGPNFELVTTALVLSSFYVGKKESFWIVFLIMLFSDIVIGNTNIFLFTWSGFLIPALFVSGFIKLLIKPYTSHFPSQRLLKAKGQSPVTKKMLKGVSLTSAGLSANIFFFLWTNFGVWLLSGMYPKTVAGLLMSYINALPFLRYQFLSTFIFIPVGFFLTELTLSVYKKHLSNNKYIKLLNTN